MTLYRRALVAAAAIATVLVAQPAHADPVLNNPTSSDAAQQQAIFRGFRAGINAARPGTLVRVVNPAMSWAVERTILNAVNRGVVVQVIQSGHAPHRPGLTDAGQALAQRLGTRTRPLGTFVHVCRMSCNAPGQTSIMHTKMLLVADAGGHPLTLITSVDLLSPLARSEFDNGFASTSRALFAHQWGWTTTMLDNRPQAFPLSYGVGPGLTVSNFPRPYSTVRDNFYSRALAPIRCRYNGHRTSVHLVTSLWSTLLAPLAWRVVHLHDQGCNVQVVLNRLRTPRAIVAIFAHNGVPFRYSNRGAFHSHVKEIAVSGSYGGHVLQTVISGTLNPSMVEMKWCDETMLRVDGSATYASFARQFSVIWGMGTTAPLPASRSVMAVR